MRAVGQHLVDKMDDSSLRMVTGLAGGVGQSRMEACGALSAGVIVISSIHGRTDVAADDTRCLELSTRYRKLFKRQLGATQCHELMEAGFGPEGNTPCSVLVERAALMLLEILGER
jgi:C_GCAxxG_C_C family probable redox protein